MKTIHSEKHLYKDTMPTAILSFPDQVNILDYTLKGYVQGDKVDSLKGLSVFHFDTLSFFERTVNPVNKKEFLHVVGLKGKKKSLLIFEKNTKPCQS